MFRDNALIAHRREKDGENQGLATHLEEVSMIAGVFASKGGLKEQGEILGLLHDIGKASAKFDQYIKSSTGVINQDEDDYVDAAELKGKIDHSSAGAQFIYRELYEENKFVAQVLSLCLASHHSGLIDCIAPDGKNVFLKRMAKVTERTHVDEVISKLSDEAITCIHRKLKSKDFIENVRKCFANLRADRDSKQTLAFKCGLLVRFLFSCLIDADRLDTADFEKPTLMKLRHYGRYEDWPILINRMNKKVEGFDSVGINAIRQKISERCFDFAERPKGLYRLTVPTGGGKTFASLRFALHHADKHKMDRIIYVLPFTTIIDQNADEIRKVLEERDSKGNFQNRIVLEHHSNLMPEHETARQKILSENWDAPVVLTTNVQVLETLFGAGTRGARRMHQLANAVIIFDEVQAMPVKCIQLFNTSVNFLVNNCGSTVVLCTATQPLFDIDRIDPILKSRSLPNTQDQQIVPDVRKMFDDLKRVEVYDKTKPGGWTTDEIRGLAEKQVLRCSSVLVVVNTKASSQRFYAQCKEFSEVAVYHLSANMCPVHRMHVLDQIKQCLRPWDFGMYGPSKPVICVSTQLIEAGVDISFGSVIRFMAGLDSIAQAAGRCNRHNELFPLLGEVIILNPAEENIDGLEDIKIGKGITERLLGDFKNDPARFGNSLIGPEAMEQYYLYYFYQRAAKMNYPVTAESSIKREDNLFNLLSVNQSSIEEHIRIYKEAPGIPLKQAFMSAAKSFDVIDSTTRGVVVPYGEEGKDIIGKLCSAMEIDKQYKLLRQAQRFSVNVFPNVLEKLHKQKALYEAQEGSGIVCLDKRYYSDEFGLSEEPTNEMDFLDI